MAQAIIVSKHGDRWEAWGNGQDGDDGRLIAFDESKKAVLKAARAVAQERGIELQVPKGD